MTNCWQRKKLTLIFISNETRSVLDQMDTDEDRRSSCTATQPSPRPTTTSKTNPSIPSSTTTTHQSNVRLACTRCGTQQLIDITHYEFPEQKGLLFECMSCGNNSIRSNVSDEERQRRLARVAADHLNIRECQFCPQRFHSSSDYLTHLKVDHAST